jgi:hypothetical protein
VSMMLNKRFTSCELGYEVSQFTFQYVRFTELATSHYSERIPTKGGENLENRINRYGVPRFCALVFGACT